MNKQYFITGIGTDVGKTVVSAIFTEALGASYWKPVQSGDLHFSDSMKVASYCSENIQVLEERFKLNTPASPHYAAKIDQVSIKISDFTLPKIEGNLIVEGAGGLHVPLNYNGDLYIDLIQKFSLPVILVSRNYLGSINHSLLSIEALQNRNIPVEFLIFSGERNEASEEIIIQKLKEYNPNVKTFYIPQAEELNKEFISKQAKLLQQVLFD